MGPKRKQPPTSTNSQKVRSKQASNKDTNPNPAKRHKSASSSMEDANHININYDLLAEAILRKQQTVNVSGSNESPIQQHTDQDSPIDVAGPNDSLNSQLGLTTEATSSSTQSSATATTAIPSTVCNHTNQFSSLLHDLFAGELGANTNTNDKVNTPLSIDEGIPLGANTPFRIKQKIWSDQFFDLRSLLPNHKESTASIQIDQSSLSFTNPTTSKSTNALSIEQWTTAFHIFMAIYIEKKPEDAPHLLKYVSVIREIAATNGDAAWHHYDETFRKLRQSHTLPWQRTISELMVSACTIHRSKQLFRNNFRPKVNDKYTKFCFNFNNGAKCRSNPCPYKHACQSCGDSGHPRIKCSKNQTINSKYPKQNSNANKHPESKS
ncbi:uncharacterized protein LOC125666211 isoform X1 [Ostrea edulis]|uniref:uncharacterized protein LOC125666211 isoform X1 n=1 Tax=Ostrea edulis TaxID=37623 RepID=UPI0024AFBDF7|nr:uncharacterized protein LOC125666211 isoform X1 [Ostrea edulis]XP_056007545.1 uncharacterized protein LOC125666211 isoform X1 [Ostrea edulis]